jgi:CheY-like chemotaxis protein
VGCRLFIYYLHPPYLIAEGRVYRRPFSIVTITMCITSISLLQSFNYTGLFADRALVHVVDYWLNELKDIVFVVIQHCYGMISKMRTSLLPSTTSHHSACTHTICSTCRRVRKMTPEIQAENEHSNWVSMAEFVSTHHGDPLKIVWSHGLCGSCYDKENQCLDLQPSSQCVSSNGNTQALLPTPTSSVFSAASISSRRRVLVVDDNRLQRSIIKRMVERAGVACDMASNGDDAIKMVQAASYDIILLDCVLGAGADGWAVSSKIRAMEREHQLESTHVVALTGLKREDELLRRCTQAGMNEVIQKPVSENALRKLLNKPT